jgi:adenosine kinase
MFNGEELLAFIDKATWVAVNDYEGRCCRSAPVSVPADRRRVKAYIVTKGADGSVIYADGREYRSRRAGRRRQGSRPGAATPIAPDSFSGS